MALFFGAGVFCNQVYCLIFRYTAIQQRFDNLSGKFNRWNVRLMFMLLGYSLSAACGFIAYRSMVAPNDVFTEFANRPPVLSRVTNDSVIMLLGSNEDFGVLAFGIFVFGGFVLVTTISICFSLSIYHTIQKNANCFTSKTYKLHRQLTLLLIVQFCLPIFFLIAPVCLASASVMFLFTIPKWSGDMSVLLFCLYTFSNALVTLLFITPYRVYTLKLLGWQKTIQHRPRISSLRTTRVEIPALDETNEK